MKKKIGDFGKNVGKKTNNLVKEAGRFINNGGEMINGVLENRSNFTNSLKHESNNLINNVGTHVENAATETGKFANGTARAVSKIDVFNSKLRKTSIDNHNQAIERYEKVAKDLENNTHELFELRHEAIGLVKDVEDYINQLANTPKEFDVKLMRIDLEINSFKEKIVEIKKAETEAKLAAGGSGASASMSALGLAVATMGPTAAMGVATTFGAASTGTAISSLTGAAASNAALAWLGGGALTAGGGGMTAGSALLALAGPVGWTLASVAFTASVGSGLFASHKNKETADNLVLERENIEKIIRRFNSMNFEINALKAVTTRQTSGVISVKHTLKGTDYKQFTKEEKFQAGLLVNSTLTLSKLINKELKLDE